MRYVLFGFSCLLQAALLSACGDDTTGDDGSGGTTGSGGSTSAGGSSGSAGSGTGGTAGSGGSSAGSAGTGSGLAISGEPCTADSQCATIGGGPSICKTDWPGGYCTKICTANLCPGGEARCETHEGEQLCLASCLDAEDCREGYTCSPLNVCVPE